MLSIFDIFSLGLLILSMGLFCYRYATQNPPILPYLVVACTCLVASWLGETGGGVYALALLMAAAFSFIGTLLYPKWRSMNDDKDKSGNAPAE